MVYSLVYSIIICYIALNIARYIALNIAAVTRDAGGRHCGHRLGAGPRNTVTQAGLLVPAGRGPTCKLVLCNTLKVYKFVKHEKRCEIW